MDRLSIPTIVVVAAIVEEAGAFLLTRRLEGSHLAGMWEFPGGKVGAEEAHEEALKRELREELDVDVEVGDLAFTVSHAYPERVVELSFYQCRLSGEARPILGQEMRWVPRDQLATLQFPPADEELVRQLSQPAVP